MNFDDKYLESYIEVIQEMDTVDEIETALPSKETKNYEEFIHLLIQRFIEIRKMLCNLLEETTDEEDREYIEKELDKNELHLLALHHCLKEDTIELENDKKRDVIFLKTAYDGISFFGKDLKTIPREYFSSVQDLYQKLKEDFHSDNESLFKRLVGDSRIKGLYELKAFKVRLVFQTLSDNTAVILALYLKKSDKISKNIKEVLSSRNAYFERNRQLLEELLSNPDTRKQLLQETCEIENNVFLGQIKEGSVRK